MSWLHPAWLLLLTAGLARAGEKPVVVSAERDNYGSLEQQALVFREERVDLSRNSNFVCGPEATVRLGAFTAGYGPELKAARGQATQMGLRLNPSAPAAQAGSAPHGQHLFIGPREVTGSKAYALPTRKILEEGCTDSLFEPGDAVEAVIEGGKRLKVTHLGGALKGQSSLQSLEAAHCARPGTLGGSPVFECRIESYGTALLLSK